MHKNIYKIKVAFLCNKNFINSINELKPFLGFDLNEIKLEKETNSINLENEVLIVDSLYVGKVSFEKITIPTILILGQNEKNTLKTKFDATMKFIEELNNSSKPLTKDYILKNIWGYSSDTDTHTIETHIYRLRQKIKNQFNDENFIKHTKEGYSF